MLYTILHKSIIYPGVHDDYACICLTFFPATLSPDKKKLQEAIFEIITSEASYYKSLSVLDKIFANSASFKNESILSKNDWKVLFGNVTEGNASIATPSPIYFTLFKSYSPISIALLAACDEFYSEEMFGKATRRSGKMLARQYPTDWSVPCGLRTCQRSLSNLR